MQTRSGDALTSPQQIGPYQVVAKLGEGGMGVVYRARDTKLDREVAVKVLPPGFAEDPSRKVRFEREAQLLASLNHPKIAAIYGVEESGATRALVMELVEGPTLADRIGSSSYHTRPKAGSGSPSPTRRSGSGTQSVSASASSHQHWSGLPLDEVLPIAHQIAEALEYAHEHGVIHRDLKPANIKVTPDGNVKVLDFGLAKAMGTGEASSDISTSPTLSLAMTQAGFILGTAAYMAPEQAKQKQVDRRADIWAFGCVVYEMLTGRMAFHGETVSDTLAEIIKGEPDWSALPPDTPPPIRRILRRCLVKDPKQRLRDIGDARIAIEETLSGAPADSDASTQTGLTSAAARILPWRRALPWALGATTVMLAVFASWLLLQPKPAQRVFRFSVTTPATTVTPWGGEPAVSPDGRSLAFVSQATQDQPPTLWLRRFDSLTSVQIPGTEGAYLPFWSPDSRWIGFEANDKLQKVSVSGGSPQSLCDVSDTRGGSWNQFGRILFGKGGALYSVPDTGGTPTLVLAPDSAQRGMSYQGPQFLPDGHHFLFQIDNPSVRGLVIAAASLDSSRLQVIVQMSSNVTYASGYLFYLEQSTLMARPFDAEALRFTGPATAMAQNVGEFSGPDYGFFSASAAGILAYQAAPEAARNQMTWFSLTGQRMSTVGEPNFYTNPVLSPDGTHLAVSIGELGFASLWVYDLRRGTASRLTFEPAAGTNPVWTHTGSQLLFSSAAGNGPYSIYEQAADGLGSAQTVYRSITQSAAIDDISTDGKYAIYDTATSPATTQLWVLPLSPDAKPFPFVQGNFGAASGQFSPDGRYVAYSSGETGRMEVYVQTFPEHTGKWQVSVSGGVQPIWRRDGKELFFLTPDQKLMAVDVNTASAVFQAGIPKELFQAQLVPTSFWRNIYVPSPDGQRFLMITPTGQTRPEPITVVVNWPALLQGRS